jgi:anti-sigma-K factor RskA
VAKLSVTTIAMAGAVPMVEPPPQLRAKILGRVTPLQKTVSLPEPKVGILTKWLGVLAAGSAVVLLVVFVRSNQMQTTIGDQAQQISQLQTTVTNQSKQIDQLDQLAKTLESSTNELRQTLLALQETNRLANLRVAMLASLAADAPKTMAVSLWDNQKQDGVFLAENLKPLASDRDYELWVIDETQTPVAAGVFHVDETGKIRMDFKPTRLVKTAGTFAVTEEKKGGVASPTLKNMVLAGN